MVFIWLVVVVMQQQTWTIRHPNATGEHARMSLSMASMPVNTVGNWMLPIDTQNAPRIAKTMIPNSTHLFSLTLCLGTNHNCLPSDPTTRGSEWVHALGYIDGGTIIGLDTVRVNSRTVRFRR